MFTTSSNTIPAFASQSYSNRNRAGQPSQSQQQKTKECSLYGFVIQEKPSPLQQDPNFVSQPDNLESTPYEQLVQFCQFIQGSNPMSKRVQFKEAVRGFAPKSLQVQDFASQSVSANFGRGRMQMAAPITGQSKSFDWKVCHLVHRESLQITEYAQIENLLEDSALSGGKLGEKYSGFGDDVDEEEKFQGAMPALLEYKKAKPDAAVVQDQVMRDHDPSSVAPAQIAEDQQQEQASSRQPRRPYFRSVGLEQDLWKAGDFAAQVEANGLAKEEDGVGKGVISQHLLKMYCEKIDNSCGVSLKQCHRLKGPKEHAKLAKTILLTDAFTYTKPGSMQKQIQAGLNQFGNQEGFGADPGYNNMYQENQGFDLNAEPMVRDQNGTGMEPTFGHGTNFYQFIVGSGFEEKYQFELRGEEFTFVLNDFVELRNRLGLDRQSVPFKATLRLSKVFKPSADQGRGSQMKEVKLLENVFAVDSGDADDQQMHQDGYQASKDANNPLAKLNVFNAELIGYCADTDQKIYTKLFAEFAQKFNNFLELAPLSLDSVCKQDAD